MTSLVAILALSTEPLRSFETKAAGATCRVIEARLDAPGLRVGVVTAQGFPGGDEDFVSMARRSGAAAAVNGAYFDKGTKRPIGDVVVDGRLLHSGRMGTVLKVSPNGEVDIQRVVRHRTYQWEGSQTVLGCGPALILDGKIDVAWQEEGFRDPHVTGSTARMAVGTTSDRRLLLVHIKKAVTFEGAAKVMLALGCREAMNLDGGASLAMWSGGRAVVRPGRRLTTLLAVWVDR